MNDQKEILDRLDDIERSIDLVEKKYTFKNMFWRGIIKGMGSLVGVVVLIIFGGWFLRFIGVVPGLEEISTAILEAANKASLQ